MGDKTRGLYEKFKVERTDGSSAPGGKHDGCQYFVLDATCDPHAIPALMAYAESCEGDYPLLARDVRHMAQGNCEHEWTETLHGPDAVGEHCISCGTDRDYSEIERLRTFLRRFMACRSEDGMSWKTAGRNCDSLGRVYLDAKKYFRSQTSGEQK